MADSNFNILTGRIKVRRETTVGWAAYNPVLEDGEPGYDTDLKKLKIGDGVTAWATLPFWDIDAATAYEIAVAEGFVGTQAAWLNSLVGPQGDPGAQGDPGPQGTRGSLWFVSAAAPVVAGTELEGDQHLNSDNGDTYEFTGGAWVLSGNILGPTGPPGADGDVTQAALDAAIDTRVAKAGDTMTGALLLPNGTVGAPAIAFSADPDSGFFTNGLDRFMVSVGGVKALDVRNFGTFFLNGTAAAPSISFDSDPDTGFYRRAVNEIGVSVGGVLAYNFASGDFGPRVDASSTLGSSGLRWTRIFMANGSAAAPAYTFGSDPDTGIYRINTDNFGLVAGGVLGARVAAGQLITANGTAAAPGLAFDSDTDTGIYRSGLDQLTLACGGVAQVQARTNGFFPMADNTKLLGASGERWSAVWAGTGTIQTSDGTQKNTVRTTDLGLNFVLKVKPRTYKFNDGVREHEGFIAQELKTVLTELGIEDRAFYIDPAVDAKKKETAGPPKKENDETQENHAERVTQWRETIQAEYNAPKGLRYSETIPPLYKAIQELHATVQAQQAQINGLLVRIEALEASA